MTQPAALCPGCGAPIVFQWSSSVQTTCAHCHSILIRTDVKLERVGVVSDLPPDSSPIQIGSSGVYQDRAFTVAGRIIYDYGEGSWNEWHIAWGTSCGIRVAAPGCRMLKAKYAVTLAFPAASLPALASVRSEAIDLRGTRLLLRRPRLLGCAIAEWKASFRRVLG